MMLNVKFAEFKGIIGTEIRITTMIAFFLFVDLTVVILLGTKIIIPVNNLQFMLNPDIGNAYAIGRVYILILFTLSNCWVNTICGNDYKYFSNSSFKNRG